MKPPGKKLPDAVISAAIIPTREIAVLCHRGTKFRETYRGGVPVRSGVLLAFDYRDFRATKFHEEIPHGSLRCESWQPMLGDRWRGSVEDTDYLTTRGLHKKNIIHKRPLGRNIGIMYRVLWKYVWILQGVNLRTEKNVACSTEGDSEYVYTSGSESMY